MIKWAPFATMPEQFDNVGNMIEAQLQVPKPNLTDELQQELELKLRDCIGKNVILRYWDSGYENQLECSIVNVDDWNEHITAIKGNHVIMVQFEHICSVDKYDCDDIIILIK